MNILSRSIVILVLFLLITEIGAIEPKIKGVGVSSSDIAADSLLKEADAVFQKRDYATALDHYVKAYEQARSEFNHSVEVEALSQMARMNLVLGEVESGRGFLATAAERATDSDPMGWSRYLSVKGRFEWKGDDLSAAGETFGQMFTYCNSNALWGRAVDAANMLSIVSETTEDQIKWSRKGIEAAEAADVESWLGPLWNNLAGIYYDLKQFDSSLSCYQKARDYHWRFSGEVAKLFADYHVGMAHRMVGDFAEARRWLRPVLAWAERLENHSVIGQACEDLGEIAIAGGDKKDGIVMLRRARDNYKAEKFDQTWPEIWENINQRLKKLGG